jgi:hypothetical protein
MDLFGKQRAAPLHLHLSDHHCLGGSDTTMHCASAEAPRDIGFIVAYSGIKIRAFLGCQGNKLHTQPPQLPPSLCLTSSQLAQPRHLSRRP